MTQTSFFPVLCHRTKPAPPTADAAFIAINTSTQDRFLCKAQGVGMLRYLPATEWICSSLARDCGLPVPPFAAIELSTSLGTYYFGSQWLGGELDALQAINRVSNPEAFSQTLGVDFFTHNIDRHLNNYLYLLIAGDVVLRPIDFSRAFVTNGFPLPALPLPANCNTIAALAKWRKYHAYTRPNQLSVTLASLTDNWMLKTIDAMPTHWLNDAQRNGLNTWWASPDRHFRVNEAQSHLP